MTTKRRRAAAKKTKDDEYKEEDEEELDLGSDDEIPEEDEENDEFVDDNSSSKKRTSSRKRKSVTKKTPPSKRQKSNINNNHDDDEVVNILTFKSEKWLKRNDTSSTGQKKKRSGPRNVHKNLKQILNLEDYSSLPDASTPTYVNIEATYSMYPKKKYCVITGLLGKYKYPTNNLRYHSSALFPIIKSTTDFRVQQYLELTNAQSKI